VSCSENSRACSIGVSLGSYLWLDCPKRSQGTELWIWYMSTFTWKLFVQVFLHCQWECALFFDTVSSNGLLYSRTNTWNVLSFKKGCHFFVAILWRSSQVTLSYHATRDFHYSPFTNASSITQNSQQSMLTNDTQLLQRLLLFCCLQIVPVYISPLSEW